jgi:hypothetical protein
VKGVIERCVATKKTITTGDVEVKTGKQEKTGTIEVTAL